MTDAMREAAVKEAARNAAVDEYFKARPQLMRTRHEECLVEAGFNAAWQACAARMLPKKKVPPELLLAEYHEAKGWNACVESMIAAAPESKP